MYSLGAKEEIIPFGYRAMKKTIYGARIMDKYLKETKMIDYSNKNIQQLIQERGWNSIEEFECLKSIYNFVRDEILFG